MDADLIAMVIARARQHGQDDPRLGPERSAPEAHAVRYDHPTPPDAHGFVAIGELHDRGRERTGIVLWHQATGSVRLTWARNAGRG